MMKKKKFKTYLMTALFLILMAISTLTVHAKAPSIKKLVESSNDSTASVDMTGDGKPDKLAFNPIKDTVDYSSGLKVTVNGKTAFYTTGHGFSHYEVQYIYQARSREFIQITLWGDSRRRFVNSIYRYDKASGKLVCVLDINASGVGAGEIVDKTTTTSIRIKNICQPDMTGLISWYYTYKYSGGRFKLVSSTASAKSIYQAENYGKYFAKNQFIANKTLTFYTGTDLKRKAFTVKAGSIVKLTKVKTNGPKMYLCFQYKSKNGWVDPRSSTAIGSFKGVNKRLAGGFLG